MGDFDQLLQRLSNALSDGTTAGDLLAALSAFVPDAGFAFAENVGGALVVTVSEPPAPPVGTTLPVDAELVPLKTRGQIRGMLHVTRAPTPDERRLIERAAPFCAAALVADSLERHAGDAQTLEGRLQLLVVHDLKNPLSIVKINVGLLLEEPDFDASEREEALTESLSATDRLLTMLDDLAIIRRAEIAGISLDTRDVDLHELLDGAVARASKQGSGRGVAVTAPPTAGRLRVDLPLAQRAVENILNNAVRYSPDRGEVRVDVARQGRFWRMLVENDGPPIPEKLVPRLFEKYGQIDVASGQRYGGRGLGLYLCRLVVEAHGGAVRAQNRGDVGVQFELTLPAT